VRLVRAGQKLLIKLVVAIAAIGGLGFLLTWSARTTGAIPYTIERESLRNWTLALNRPSGPNEPVLVLQPSADLSSGLFNQIFKRAMESMSIPKSPGIPLVLQSELDLGGRVSVETLVAAAREAGLDSTPLQPRCVGRRRVSEPGSTRQLYFVLFDAPAFSRFRDRLATMLGSSFDPAAQSPVLMVAVAESNLSHWLPLRADPQKDCVAPIEIGSK
jgi:hypothetical protein